MVLEKTLESPLDYKEVHQSILKEISPGCSLEGLMLKLKLQYFGHLMQRTDSLEKTLMLGRIDAEAEALILWPSDVKSQFTGKHPDAGKDRGQEKRASEDEKASPKQWT